MQAHFSGSSLFMEPSRRGYAPLKSGSSPELTHMEFFQVARISLVRRFILSDKPHEWNAWHTELSLPW